MEINSQNKDSHENKNAFDWDNLQMLVKTNLFSGKRGGKRRAWKTFRVKRDLNEHVDEKGKEQRALN